MYNSFTLMSTRYIDRIFLGVDGNFRLKRKAKPNVSDPNDVALALGRLYFRNDAEFRAYVAKIESADELPEDKNVSHRSGHQHISMLT